MGGLRERAEQHVQLVRGPGRSHREVQQVGPRDECKERNQGLSGTHVLSAVFDIGDCLKFLGGFVIALCMLSLYTVYFIFWITHLQYQTLF